MLILRPELAAVSFGLGGGAWRLEVVERERRMHSGSRCRAA